MIVGRRFKCTFSPLDLRIRLSIVDSKYRNELRNQGIACPMADSRPWGSCKARYIQSRTFNKRRWVFVWRSVYFSWCDAMNYIVRWCHHRSNDWTSCAGRKIKDCNCVLAIWPPNFVFFSPALPEEHPAASYGDSGRVSNSRRSIWFLGTANRRRPAVNAD